MSRLLNKGAEKNHCVTLAHTAFECFKMSPTYRFDGSFSMSCCQS